MKTLRTVQRLFGAVLIAASASTGAAPVLVGPDNNTLNPVELTWTDVHDPLGPFTVYIGTSFTSLDPWATGITTTSYLLPHLQPATYFWRVGNSLGETSVTRSFAIQVAPPAVIPEPGSLPLAVAALVGVAMLGRVRRIGSRARR